MGQVGLLCVTLDMETFAEDSILFKERLHGISRSFGTKLRFDCQITFLDTQVSSSQ